MDDLQAQARAWLNGTWALLDTADRSEADETGRPAPQWTRPGVTVSQRLDR